MHKKYDCRQCHVRDRCINESHNPSSIRSMFRYAFESRTDTLATWRRLQVNCLLAEAEEAKAEEAKAEEIGSNALSRRLRRVRAAKVGVYYDQINGREATKDSANQDPADFIGYNEFNTELDKHPPKAAKPDYLKPTQIGQKHLTGPLKPLPAMKPEISDEPELYWLTVEGTWRHITLPTTGTLVLGRFDPRFGIPPDIDLSLEDNETYLISRRHASIIGENGRYTIEDLGSHSGVFLNGERLGHISSHLKPGDRLQLGNVEFTFDRVPHIVLESTKKKWARHVLTVTATGEKFTITPSRDTLIGRGDPKLNFMPDLDMGRYGPVGQRVSRHHALIQWRDGQPYVEDLGSGFGTRLRGELLLLGRTTPLLPGDHMWLAGCVLAYDVEVEQATIAA